MDSTSTSGAPSAVIDPQGGRARGIPIFQWYRIAAAFLILLIHQQFWPLPSFLDALTGVAVPLFSVIAGYLLVRGVVSAPIPFASGLGPLLRKKAQRILVPYALWAVLYWLTNNVVLDGLVRHQAITVPGPKSWLLGGTACHLWFLPDLFVAICLMAAMLLLASRASARRRPLLLRLLFALAMALAVCAQWIPDPTSATLAGHGKIYFARLLFYVALGGCLALPTPFHAPMLAGTGGALAVIGIGLLCLGSRLPSTGRLLLQPLPLVVGLTLLATVSPRVPLPSWADRLARATMGIYLIHPLFARAADLALGMAGHPHVGALAGFAASLALFGISFLAVRLLPKRLFGG